MLSAAVARPFVNLYLPILLYCSFCLGFIFQDPVGQLFLKPLLLMKLKGFLNYPVQRGEDRVAHNQGTSRRGGSVAGELNFGKSKNTLRVPRGQSVCEVMGLHQQQMCFLWGWGVGGGVDRLSSSPISSDFNWNMSIWDLLFLVSYWEGNICN